MRRDFTPEQLRDFTIRKEILWEPEAATRSDVSRKEIEFIRLHRSNDPEFGYNRWPKVHPPEQIGPESENLRAPAGNADFILWEFQRHGRPSGVPAKPLWC